MAIRYPELVRSLVLMEPPVMPLFVSAPPRPRELLRLLFTRPATAFAPAEKAYRRGDDAAAMRIFGCGVLGKASFERLSEARKQQVRDNQKTDRAQLLGAGFPPLTDAQVRGVRAPALLLAGEDSPRFLCKRTGRLRELLPASDFVEISKASHLMHEDNDPMVNAAILDFLDRHTS